MSKRKKRRTRVAEEDAASRQSTPGSEESAPRSVANAPGRYQLALLIVAVSLWVGSFAFLVYVAISRK